MSSFSEKIYRLCSSIPKGKVTTYAELARALNTKAYRAVGHAMKCNPNAPIVPCHRVILSSGDIGNYSGPGGQKRKIYLLEKEGVVIHKKKVDLNRFLHRF